MRRSERNSPRRQIPVAVHLIHARLTMPILDGRWKTSLTGLESDASHLVDGREGRKAVEIILAIYQSSREGRPVELPL